MIGSLPVALVLAGILVLPAAAAARQNAEALRARGLELSFNLDHPEALAVFRESIKTDPDNLAGYRLLTAAFWADALFRTGAISADDLRVNPERPFAGGRRTSSSRMP